MHGLLNMLLAALPVTVISCEDYLNAAIYKFNGKTFETWLYFIFSIYTFIHTHTPTHTYTHIIYI